MESCGMTIIKYLLFFFNAFFAILGILIIVAASIDISLIKEYSNMDEVSGIETDIILIVIGLLILLIAAFGCFGAIKESPKLLYAYAGFLILIILLELSVGIAAASLRPQMETTMKKHLRDSFIKNKGDNLQKKFWDKLQMKMMCCGARGPDDYLDVAQNVPVPPLSCCPSDCCPNADATTGSAQATEDQKNQARRAECVRKQTYYKEGCEDKILETVHGAGLAVIVTGIVFCFLEVIGIILALWLANAIKNERKTYASDSASKDG